MFTVQSLVTPYFTIIIIQHLSRRGEWGSDDQSASAVAAIKGGKKDQEVETKYVNMSERRSDYGSRGLCLVEI